MRARPRYIPERISRINNRCYVNISNSRLNARSNFKNPDTICTNEKDDYRSREIRYFDKRTFLIFRGGRGRRGIFFPLFSIVKRFRSGKLIRQRVRCTKLDANHRDRVVTALAVLLQRLNSKNESDLRPTSSVCVRSRAARRSTNALSSIQPGMRDPLAALLGSRIPRDALRRAAARRVDV